MRLSWLGSIGRGGRALAVATTMLAVATAVAVAAPGDLDTNFDGDGRLIIDYGGLTDTAYDVLVQPDGKIVSVGHGVAPGDFAISRVNSDGSPDTGFGGGDGTVGIDFGGSDTAYGVARQADGKIVAVGYTSMSDRVAVLRLNPDGGLDANFGLNGLRTIEYGGQDGARDVLLQPDGKIILAAQGGNTAPNAQNIQVTRLDANGTPDPSFGIGGTTALDFGGRDLANAVALQDDGKVVVTGSTGATGGGDIVVVRLNANGSPDDSFDGEGRKTINLNAQDSGQAVLVQPDGKIVVAGYRDLAGGAPVVRMEPDGSLDRSFAGSTVLVPGIPRIYDAALLANGKLVVAGLGPEGTTGVARVQPGGSPDDTFGGDGSVSVDAPEGDSGGEAVAIQANGAMVVAGYVDTFPSPQEDNVFLARLDGDPLDSGGGPGGGGTGDGGAGGGGQGGGGPGGGPGGGGGFTLPRCAGKRATIVGTSRKDRLRGTRRADVIVALGGNDIIKGGRGNDRICAGSGNDSIAGESGNDRIYGQSGKDKATGGSGNDRIDGGSSADRIAGQSGKDSLSGGSGNDRIDGGSSKDRINGNSGKDKCAGGSGKDRAKCERKRSI